MNAVDRKRSLRPFHRAGALLLTGFVLLHIANHVVGLAEQEEHVAFMRAVRPYYRHPVVESVLLALFALQVATGATLAIRGWRRRRGAVAWAQAFSGLCLGVFLVVHVASVVTGRVSLGLDTDFRFAAAGFHVVGWPWFFAPYYFLGVFALFVHIGCALYWNIGGRARFVLAAMTVLGAAFALAFVASLAGLLHPVAIPQRYLATYRERQIANPLLDRPRDVGGTPSGSNGCGAESCAVR